MDELFLSASGELVSGEIGDYLSTAGEREKETRQSSLDQQHDGILRAGEGRVKNSQFGGRLVLRDGSGEADVAIDITNEQITLSQDDRTLGTYPLADVEFLRMTNEKIVMIFAGEIAYFYPFRQNEFVKTLRTAKHGRT